MNYVQVATQAELDRVLRDQPDDRAVLVGSGSFRVEGSSHVVAGESSHVEAWGSSHVEAWGSSHVVAWESSHVVAGGSSHVEARGSSHVVARGSAHVVAWESSHVVAWESSHVVAWESSHVEAGGSSHVVAGGSSHVVAGQYVAVHQHSEAAVVLGGTVIRVRRPTNPVEWCAFYGAKLDGEIAIVYKAVRDDYRSSHGLLYQPGTTVEAPDWDGGRAECGGGLHFSPHPAMALEFDSKATHFLACPVALADMRSPTDRDDMPHKIKARRTAGPVYEVDRSGRPLAKATA